MALAPGQVASTSSRLGAAKLGCTRLAGTLPDTDKPRDSDLERRSEWEKVPETESDDWTQVL